MATAQPTLADYPELAAEVARIVALLPRLAPYWRRWTIHVVRAAAEFGERYIGLDDDGMPPPAA